MNDDELGKMTCLGLRILLEGAVRLLEEHPLKPLCETESSLGEVERQKRESEKFSLRLRVFRQGYWLSPYGDVSCMRSGILRRVQFCKADGDIPIGICNLIGFIQSCVRSFDVGNLEECRRTLDDVFKPAIRECDSLLAGSIPKERGGQQ